MKKVVYCLFYLFLLLPGMGLYAYDDDPFSTLWTGENLSNLTTWEKTTRKKVSEKTFTDFLYSYYQLQHPENLAKAERAANDLIAKGKDLVKKGKRLMRQEDYTTKSFAAGGGDRFVSRENVRAEGRELYVDGMRNIIKGEAILAVIRETLNNIVKPEMMRNWTSKDGKNVRGAVLELRGKKVQFITPKMKFFEFDIDLLSKADADYVLEPRFDMKIEIEPNVFSGKLLSGDEAANPIVVKLLPAEDNYIKKINLDLDVKVDGEILTGLNYNEEISIKSGEAIFRPRLNWDLKKLKALREDENISLKVSAVSGQVSKNKNSIVNIKPPLVFADIKDFSSFDGGVFPSMILSGMRFYNEKSFDLFPFRNAGVLTYKNNILCDSNPFVGLKISIKERNGFDTTNIRIQISSNNGIIEETIYTSEIPLEKADEFYIYPPISWNNNMLRMIKEPQKTSFRLTYSFDNQKEHESVVDMIVYPVNDVPLFAPDPIYGMRRNYTNLFAAFVNEHNPMIEEIKREALNKRYIDAFYGEQNGPKGIINQIQAIWKVLQDRGIKYSSYTESSANSSDNGVFSQRVRFLEETLNSSQANCVDGSILLASIFKNIGLKSYLIVAPGHMYCAVGIKDKESGVYIKLPIETTLIGEGVDIVTAIKKGMDNLKEREKSLTAYAIVDSVYGLPANIKDRINDDYMIIDVDNCRKANILPIASMYNKE